MIESRSISDATVNRNSDKENGTIYPVTPTKELGSDFSVKHHVSSNSLSENQLDFTKKIMALINFCYS